MEIPAVLPVQSRDVDCPDPLVAARRMIIHHEKTTPDHPGIASTGHETPHARPAWITVFLVVVVLSLAALPGAIASGITPILLVSSAVVLLLSTFGKD